MVANDDHWDQNVQLLYGFKKLVKIIYTYKYTYKQLETSFQGRIFHFWRTKITKAKIYKW